MRKAIFLLIIVLFLPKNLWATDPIIGTWELDVSKSKFTPALLEEFGIARPKQETIVVRELNDDELEFVVTGSDIDGKQNSQKYTVPKQRGIEKSQIGGPPKGSYWVQIKISEKEIYRTLIENGKQSTTLQHGVISQDGNALSIKITGIDNQGKSFQGLYFFKRQ